MYCKYCGTTKKEVEIALFDENTGKRKKCLACPKIGCKGNCAFYGCDYTNYMFKTNRCKNCGEIPYSECY